MMRTRWAAIGAAVAVTLGAGGIGLVSATSPSDAVTYVPIEPCRLFDTRPAFQVGPRDTPLQQDETYVVAAHGDNGQCTNIPDTATGLGLNVTADDPSVETVLTIWGDGPRPNASSLNPAPGEPPTPNAVTGLITSDGELRIWNAFGTVHVLADVVGYYTDHHHDDRYYTEPEVDSALEEVDAALDAKPDEADVYTKTEVDAAVEAAADAAIEASKPIAASGAGETQHYTAAGGPDIVATVSITPPVDGTVLVNSTAQLLVFSDVIPATPKATARCSITTGSVVDTGELQQVELIAETVDAGAEFTFATIAGTRAIVASADAELTINLVCEVTDLTGEMSVERPRLTAIFSPD